MSLDRGKFFLLFDLQSIQWYVLTAIASKDSFDSCRVLSPMKGME